MNIQEVEVEKIRPYERNAKTHTGRQVEQIANSIRQFGFRQPIVLDKNGVIIIGHGRYQAAMQLKMKTVPCVRAEDLTEEQVAALRLADNKLNESDWDMDNLEKELAEIQDIDMAEFGFADLEDDEDNLDDIVEDKVPEDVEPRAKLGEIYKLGRHRLICGDSTDGKVIKKLMGGGECSLLLTDPPYNVSVGDCDRPNSSHNNVHILNDSMEEGDFIKWLSKALKNANDSMVKGAAFYIFYAGLHHTEFDYSTRSIPDWKVHEQIVWVKGHFVLGRNSDYQWQHELALYGWKTGAPHYFTNSRAEGTVIEDTSVRLSSLKKGELIALCEKLMKSDEPSTVVRADKPASADLHPTVKPQELLCYLLKNSSRQGDNVLDLFGGSGSTLIACEQLNRTCFMCELDPKYVDVIISRWESFTGQAAELISE